MDDRNPRSGRTRIGRREILFGSATVLGSALAIQNGAALGQAPVARNAPIMDSANANADPVAFLLDEGATVIDFAGSWDVFSDATRSDAPLFRPIVVAPTREAIRTISGMMITPDFSFDDAPRPKILVVPAQGRGGDARKLEWIRATHKSAEAVISVCTGSFLLARAGLLDGQQATTHPDAFDLFERTFPSVRLRKDAPFVLAGTIGTASAGLTGIDLALNIVARMADVAVAEEVAKYMGHRGTSWRTA